MAFMRYIHPDKDEHLPFSASQSYCRLIALSNMFLCKVSKDAKIKNRLNQVRHLTQDTNGKVKTHSKTPQTRDKRLAPSQQVTTRHK